MGNSMTGDDAHALYLYIFFFINMIMIVSVFDLMAICYNYV